MQARYRTYAFLSGTATEHKDKFDFTICEPLKDHATKLNILAEIASQLGEPNDILMFLDGDAFPISPIAPFANDILSKYPLAAVVRSENQGDVQPHPMFCITTGSFWKTIKGDWKRGYQWVNSFGIRTTDVGGNLLGRLEQEKIIWYPILRSNKKNLHPLMFGVYGDIIYHHGAGFRSTVFRMGKQHRIHRSKFIRKMTYFLNKNKVKTELKENARLSENVYTKIQVDEQFFKEFI